MTLGQFQEIYKVQKSDIDREEKLTEMVAILANKTVNEVEAMKVPDFEKLAIKVKEALREPLVTQKPEEALNGYHKPEKLIGGYGITYELGKLDRGQYVTVMHFLQGDYIENAHLILASITYNQKTLQHESDRHQQIADELQEVDLAIIAPCLLFFCHVFETSIKSLGSYLGKQLTKGKNPQEASYLLTTLTAALDGYSMQSR